MNYVKTQILKYWSYYYLFLFMYLKHYKRLGQNIIILNVHTLEKYIPSEIYFEWLSTLFICPDELHCFVFF